MRISRLLFKTQKDTPADVDTISHELLLRSGMIAQIAAGVYSYTPLAQRVLQKIESVIREEMNNSGCQEISMPVLQPLEIWQKTGRNKSFGKSLFTLKDRKDRTLVLGPTHEEVVTDLVSRFVQSYRDLPLALYQLQTKFRDELRPRAGLIRVREFIMKDCYSFHTDTLSLDSFYDVMKQVYLDIYKKCGLQAIMIDADSGAIGGKSSNEFILVAPSGEDSVLYCEACGYAANSEKAVFQKTSLGFSTLMPLAKKDTPGQKSVEDVSSFLGINTSQTLKCVLYIADDQIIMALIRGDYSINETKLKNALKCIDLREATTEEITKHGLVAGYCGPIGQKKVRILADDSVQNTNLASGANEIDKHYLNTNLGRDFEVESVLDIALAEEGHACACCGEPYSLIKGIEVGHIFKLGTYISNAMGATFTDENGSSKVINMGCYGIGVGRLLAAAIEQNHDQNGIVWPMAIAPYHVLITPLYGNNKAEIEQVSENLYKELTQNNVETLIDDREESAGVKFNDADLIGIPIRVTIGKKGATDGICEIKLRDGKESSKIPFSRALSHIQDLISSGLK